jgi:hypothetical protein
LPAAIVTLITVAVGGVEIIFCCCLERDAPEETLGVLGVAI